MSGRRPHKLLAVILILNAILAATAGQVLAVTFGWPGILDRPAAEALPKFSAAESSIVSGYYLFATTSVLFIVIAVGLHRALAREDRPWLVVFSAFGVLAGIAQLLGWLRWPFVVPALADAWADPASSAATREAVEVVYGAINSYAGNALGEHLGFLFQAIWVVGLGLAMLRSDVFPRWLGVVGIVSAVGFQVGDYGAWIQPGVALFETLNYAFYTLFALWTVVVGVVLLRARPVPLERTHP